ncbi:MAG: hypothetical protein AABZ14_02375, partial [Candidatus Margulisiibacteriota bacterium]
MILDNEQASLTANQVSMFFNKYSLRGQQICLATGDVRLTDAVISSCRGRNPIFYLKSGEVLLYSKLGFLVAFNSILHVYDVPVFYFPAYFMGDKRFSIFAENTIVPELGSNLVEGNFIRENIPYYVNESNNGVFHIGYIEKMGIKVGVAHHSILGNPKQKGSVAVYYTPTLWQGHLSLTVSLFDEQTQDQSFLGLLFNEATSKNKTGQVDLTYLLSYHELVNNQLVCKLPSWKLSGATDIDELSKVEVSLEQSSVLENNITRNNKTSLMGQLNTSYCAGSLRLGNAVEYVHNRYENFGTQERFQDKVLLEYTLHNSLLSGLIEHVFYFQGSSPFAYDMYQVDGYDKLTVGLKIKWLMGDVEYRIKKRLDQEVYYSRRIEVTMPFEQCIDFQLYYEDVEKVFG